MDTTPLLPTQAAPVPADIRKEGPKALQLYQTAADFENLLLKQLTQSLGSILTSDGSDDSTDDGQGGDATTSLMAQQIPDALAQSLTASGGLGLARQLYDEMKGKAS